MKAFLGRQWFLISLVVVVFVGLTGSGWLLEWAQRAWLRSGIVMLVMFVMALPLEAGQLWKSLRRPHAALLAIAMNYAAMPLLAWPLSRLFTAETGYGILVAAVTPCTLASAAVWTRRAGGNDAAALMVTLVTNASCFIVAPCWLWLLIGAQVSALDWQALVLRLAILVLLPIVVAQLCRQNLRLARWSVRHRRGLSTFAQVGILSMVLLGSAQLAPQLVGSFSGKLGEWSGMAMVVLGLHLIVLWLGWRLSGWLHLDRADRIAVGIAGSQKTLMVGLSLAMDLGVSILPMVTFHLGQLFLDTIVADRWARQKPPPDVTKP